MRNCLLVISVYNFQFFPAELRWVKNLKQIAILITCLGVKCLECVFHTIKVVIETMLLKQLMPHSHQLNKFNSTGFRKNEKRQQ